MKGAQTVAEFLNKKERKKRGLKDLCMIKGPEEGFCWCAGCGEKCPEDAYDEDTNTYVANECGNCQASVCFECFDPKNFPESREKYGRLLCPVCADSNNVVDLEDLVYAEDVLEEANNQQLESPAKKARSEEEN